MGRKKKAVKAKTFVTLRQKQLRGGGFSLYLDIYKDGHRVYDFIKLYLKPEVDAETKAYNQNILAQAETIRASKEQEVLSNKVTTFNGKGLKEHTTITAWFEYYIKAKTKANRGEGTLRALNNALKMLRRFIKEEHVQEPTLGTIDRDFCQQYSYYLRKVKSDRGEHKPLSQFAQCNYYVSLSSALNYAEKESLLNGPNPARSIHDRISMPKDSTREYLTADEVKRFAEVECYQYSDVKLAFLFSCFCGLRYSDIFNLTWGDLHKEGDAVKLRIVVQKTKDAFDPYLSAKAQSYLPERNGAPDKAKIFNLPKANASIQTTLGWIAAQAKIAKKVTFHVARHTFATLCLTAGVDIYTTAKLLNHKRVATTQIYADIIDQKKRTAVSMVDNLFND